MLDANVLYLVASLFGISSFFSRDMLVLRSLYLVASSLFVTSGIIFHIPIMVATNSIYILTNSIQVVLLIIERTNIMIPHELVSIYNNLFFNMTSREFIRFVKIAERISVPSGEYLFYEGEAKEFVMLIVSGEVAVLKGKKVVASLSRDAFVGEMHYLTHKPVSASIKSVSEVVYLSFKHSQLLLLKKKDPALYMKFITVLGRDLATKIQNMDQSDVGEGEIANA